MNSLQLMWVLIVLTPAQVHSSIAVDYSSQSLLKAVVVGGTVYTCGREQKRPPFTRAIHWSTLQGTNPKSLPPRSSWSPLPGGWTVANGRLWWAGRTNGVAEIIKPDDSLISLRIDSLQELKFREGLSSEPACAVSGKLLSGFSPLQELRSRWTASEAFRDIELSYIPLSEEKIRIFLLENIRKGLNFGEEQATLTVYLYKPVWSRKTRSWDSKASKWHREEIIHSPPFADQVGSDTFHAFQRGTTYYFVTDSGKVYAAPKPAKGPRKFVTIHADKKRPVVAILTDDKAKRTFVFCEAPKSTKGVLLELADKARPIAYDRAKVAPVKIKEPLKRVLEYARVLQANKLLKAK